MAAVGGVSSGLLKARDAPKNRKSGSACSFFIGGSSDRKYFRQFNKKKTQGALLRQGIVSVRQTARFMVECGGLGRFSNNIKYCLFVMTEFTKSEKRL